jgi:hypothetical protein
MNPIAFSTKQDYKTYMKTAFLQYSRRWQTKVIFPFFIFISARAIFDSDSKGSILSIVIISLAMIASIFSFYIKAKNTYRSTPNAGEEIFWKINETGVHVTGNSFSQHLGWDSITKFSENKQCFFIWFNDTQNTYFPKSIVSEKELFEIKKIMFVNGKKGL